MVARRSPPLTLPFALRWRRRLRNSFWLLLLAALLGLLWWTGRPEPREGRLLFVSDGDSFTINDGGDRHQVRLVGIDAPELAQNCQTAAGMPWRCGVAARDMLSKLVPRGTTMVCRSAGNDKFNRALSRCRLPDGSDLAAQIVSRGWAIATTEDYLLEEDQARSARSGLWQGDFLTPAEWRAANPRK
jgi:endonuclease YncB( thermonuclease family)